MVYLTRLELLLQLHTEGGGDEKVQMKGNKYEGINARV